MAERVTQLVRTYPATGEWRSRRCGQRCSDSIQEIGSTLVCAQKLFDLRAQLTGVFGKPTGSLLGLGLESFLEKPSQLGDSLG
jgi:hypothetical protein